MTSTELINSVKHYIEIDFWPKHRTIEQPMLLMLKVPQGEWVDIALVPDEAQGDFTDERIMKLMRGIIAVQQPYAAAMIGLMRVATADPDAHFDHVFVNLETKIGKQGFLVWRRGLDDTSIRFVDVGDCKLGGLGNLYNDIEDYVRYWTYLRSEDGTLSLIGEGAFPRQRPVSKDAIKQDVYETICSATNRKLDKKSLIKDIVVTYAPLAGVQETK